MRKYSPLKPISRSGKYEDSSSESESVSNQELLTMVLKRLKKLEQDHEIIKISLKTKDMQIKYLEREVERLAKENEDVSDFDDQEDVSNGTIDSVVQDSSFPFDINQIKNAIVGLNVEAGEGQKMIILDRGAHQLVEKAQRLDLKIFKNGIYFREGPFRSFSSDPSAISFLRDIADGYYPHELKDKYPDGVAFNLEDYHTQIYHSSINIPPKVVQSKSIKKSYTLEKLPKCVIKEGNIINIKGDIQELLNPSIGNMKKPRILSIPHKTTEKETVMIRIKNARDPNTILEIKVDCKETVANLIELIGQDQNSIVLYMPSRKGPLKNNMTLKEYDLAPRSLLYLQKKSS